VLIDTYQHVCGDYCEDLDYPEDGDRKTNRNVDKYVSFIFVYVPCIFIVYYLYVPVPVAARSKA